MLIDEIKQALADLAVIEKIEITRELPAPVPTEGEADDAKAATVTETETVEQPALHTTEYTSKGFHLSVTISPDDVVSAAKQLLKQEFFLEAVTGVDWLKENQMEVVYDYNHWNENCRVVVRTFLNRETPELPTISEVYSGANWHERETHDFFGIKFLGHPDLSPFLLPEDADYHPLLKDFKA
nr:NADH-quinone oxidoreductase subunit C [Desulfobulbaceae bacterium]